jgi:hypothetical protein
MDDYEKTKTINGRCYNDKSIKLYIKKINKDINVNKSSICLRKNKQGKKLMKNVDNNKIYFNVEARLGKADEIVAHESYFGEVYKLLIPKKKKELAAKVIPLTNDDIKYKFDIHQEPWKELFIMNKITRNILNKKISPHFSFTYGYYFCNDGNIKDFSNINIVNKIKIRTLLKKLKEDYTNMSDTMDEFKGTNRTAISIANNLSIKIRSLGIELEKYEYNIKYPNPKYNLIILLELETSTLTKVLNAKIRTTDKYKTLLDIPKLGISNKIKNKFYYNESYNQLKDSHDYSHTQMNKLEKHVLQNNLKFIPDTTPAYFDRVYMYSILFQMISAINNLSKLQIAHLDLHVENVLYKTSQIPLSPGAKMKYSFWKYKIDNDIFYIPDYGLTFKIADFGLSESIESYNKYDKKSKKELGEYVVDKLSYFVISKKEEEQIEAVSSTIINNIIVQDSKIIFEYLSLFDIIIFLISLISEVEYIARNRYLQIQDENLEESTIDILLHSIIFPPYLNTLKLLQTKLLNIFINNMGSKNKIKSLDKIGTKKFNNKYLNLVDEIIDIFHEDNISIDKNDYIINKKEIYS